MTGAREPRIGRNRHFDHAESFHFYQRGKKAMRAVENFTFCFAPVISAANSNSDYAEFFILDMSVSAIAAGVSATAIPAACSASIFPAAVPLPAEMIAPA